MQLTQQPILTKYCFVKFDLVNLIRRNCDVICLQGRTWFTDSGFPGISRRTSINQETGKQKHSCYNNSTNVLTFKSTINGKIYSTSVGSGGLIKSEIEKTDILQRRITSLVCYGPRNNV